MTDEFLAQLHAEGVQNDATANHRDRMRFNITANTGRFLDILVVDARPRRILELGTSNGYSTIWLARAAERLGSRVDSVDVAAAKTSAAADNLGRVGLASTVNLHTCDASDYLCDCESQMYDFVFLDSARDRYASWFDDLIRVTDFGTIVVDNAISHAAEVAPLAQRVYQHPELASCVLPIGKGQMVIRRAADGQE